MTSVDTFVCSLLWIRQKMVWIIVGTFKARSWRNSEDALQKLGTEFSQSWCCPVLKGRGRLWYKNMSLQPYLPTNQRHWSFSSWDLSTRPYLIVMGKAAGAQYNSNDTKEDTISMWIPGYFAVDKWPYKLNESLEESGPWVLSKILSILPILSLHLNSQGDPITRHTPWHDKMYTHEHTHA